MRCEECQSLLEEFFDEELDRPTAEDVRHHISGCAGCAGALDNLKSENALYAGYEREVQVTPNTWAAIQDSITRPLARSEARRPIQNQWIAALVAARVNAWVVLALVLLSVGVTVFLMKHRRESPSNEKSGVPVAVQRLSSSETERSLLESTSADKHKESDKDNSRVNGRSPTGLTANRTSPVRPPSPARGNRSAEQLVKEAEQKYLAAITMLSIRVNRSQSRLDEDTKLKFEQALTSIDRTIARTRLAVRQHPEDPIAVQYMLTAYSRKVDVLREMASY
jgi:hypothetical protein